MEQVIKRKLGRKLSASEVKALKKNGTKVKACRVQPLRNRKITCQSSNALTRKASAVAATRVAVVSPTHEVNVSVINQANTDDMSLVH